MEFIAHRINTLKELSEIPVEYGVELDVRDYKNELVLNHEPFRDGELFEEYLKKYAHGTMIVNVKSEGIEERAIELLDKYNIKKWFFLDSSFPMIYKLSRRKEKRFAVRVSEFESIETALSMKDWIEWVWIDCFSKFPLDKEMMETLQKAGLRTCLVSPELQGRDDEVIGFSNDLRQRGLVFDAVCAKLRNEDVWKLMAEKL